MLQLDPLLKVAINNSFLHFIYIVEDYLFSVLALLVESNDIVNVDLAPEASLCDFETIGASLYIVTLKGDRAEAHLEHLHQLVTVVASESFVIYSAEIDIFAIIH